MKYLYAVEIGREEAFELCNCELPTNKIEKLIVRQKGHPAGDEVIFKENGKYYIAPFNSNGISIHIGPYDPNCDIHWEHTS